MTTTAGSISNASTTGRGLVGAGTIASEHTVGSIRAQRGHEVIAVATAVVIAVDEACRSGRAVRIADPFAGEAGHEEAHHTCIDERSR